MKESVYKSYDDLPLFLNSATVAKVLGVSPSSGYELMHEPGFPVLRIGNRMVVVAFIFPGLPSLPASTPAIGPTGMIRGNGDHGLFQLVSKEPGVEL